MASPGRREKLVLACGLTDTPVKLCILDVQTRWNSTHDMIIRAFEIKEVRSFSSKLVQNKFETQTQVHVA